MTNNPGRSLRRTFAALRVRNFRIYIVSQFVSFSGTWAQALAMSWLVLELTDSGTALGTVTAMQFVPILLLGPYGGTIADRVDKRRLILWTHSINAALALTLGVITLTGVVELWMVYTLAAAFGVVTAVDNPTRQIFLMELVGAELVSNAVTLNSVVVNTARVIGPAIGGVLIATVGIGLCFVVNSVSYMAVILALLVIRTEELDPVARTRRAPGQLRAGFAYVRGDVTLRTTLIVLAIVGTLGYEFNVTLPLLAERTFDGGASELAALTALMGAGAVMGGLTIAARGKPSPQVLSSTATAFGVSMLVLSLTPTIATAYVVIIAVGATSIAMIAAANAVLQLYSAPHMRGRVMSLFTVAVIGSTPIGGPIVGWIGEHVDPRAAILVGGLAALSAAGFSWIALRAADSTSVTRT